MTSSNLADLVAPGQEELLEGIAEEIEAEERGEGLETPEQAMQEGEQSNELIGGKFKNQEELLKAYQELERKRGESTEESTDEGWNYKADDYTPELSKQVYGEQLTSVYESTGVNPFEMAEAVYAGKDVTEYVDKLAEGGIPKDIMLTYLSGISETANPSQGSSEPVELSEADSRAITDSIGGESKFAELGKWMEANLTAAELAGYNEAINTGNKAVAQFAVQQMAARKGGQADPPLISGGSASQVETFSTDREALEARNKRDKQGRFLYERDSKYRAWYDKTMENSGNIFG